jgi:mono/diheme cytochrome c family protein
MIVPAKKVKLAIVTLAIPLISILLLLPGATMATGSESGAAEGLFKAKCAVCHGVDGSGNTVMGKKLNVRDLRSPQVQKISDTELNHIIARGKEKMPSFEKALGRDQVDQLVSYTRELAKKH